VPVNLGLDFQQLSGTLIAIISILSAIGIAVWIALTIWTFRDMKARSRDTFGQILAALVVAVLSIPGFLVYLILRPRETLAEQYERALEEEALLQEIENRLRARDKRQLANLPLLPYKVEERMHQLRRTARPALENLPLLRNPTDGREPPDTASEAAAVCSEFR
jgi:hypothetical protein